MLDMRAATFYRGERLLAPLTVALDEGRYSDVTCETSMAAAIAARVAAGIVKCTSGIVFIGNFDPKIQPVQVKRLVGFVSRDYPRRVPESRAYFAYRASLWELSRDEALARGATLLQRFDGLADDQALALAGALLHRPRLLVLDRPGMRLREAAAEAASEAAVFAVYGPNDRPAQLSIDPLVTAGAL